MAHIYLLFDFAKDEEKAQLARHKLESWKQAFRLDKKLLYKVERTGTTPADGDAKTTEPESKPAQAEKGKTKGKAKREGETAATKAETKADTSNEDVKLLIRLAFSVHEKLSEQRWVQRIPAEEPFQGASPKVIKAGDEGFEATEKQFDELD